MVFMIIIIKIYGIPEGEDQEDLPAKGLRIRN